MPTLSIVVPTHNGAQLLRECLASLEQQEYLDFNVIVVDNGSDDDTEQAVRDYNNEVELVRLQENAGFAKAVNVGIKASKADLVMVVNNDVTLAPGCIGYLVDAVRNNFYASFAPLVFQYERREIVDSAGLMFSNRGYGNRSNRFTIAHVGCPTEIFCPCGSIALYRRAVLDEVGWFNEDFFMFFEDLEIGFRLQLHGYKSLLIPQANAFHRGGATAKYFKELRVEQSLKNALATLITCVPADWFVRDAFRIVHFYSLLLYSCVQRGYLKEVVKALAMTVYRLPRLLSRRACYQRRASYNAAYLRDLLYSGAVEVHFSGAVVSIPGRLASRKSSLFEARAD